ncbi:hypothetical protein ACH5RR_020106 [Cinchona calisaya]|uniref:Uncharacterized protein n=1 Tax=Cinchona calisaya TaxID=153742 RepID=A0ABD2ZHB4_9GENT
MEIISDAAQTRKLFLQRRCAHKTQARLLQEFTSQKPSTTGSQIGWPNIASLFLNKWSSPDDSTAKRDQKDKISLLKDELLHCGGDAENIERVLKEKGVPLFRSYKDGSAVVELLVQLASSPDLALQVFNWRREQLGYGAPMTTEEYAKV